MADHKRTLNLPADVARCTGGTCPKKLTCRRYLAGPIEDWWRVAWFTEPPNNGDECDYYMERN